MISPFDFFCQVYLVVIALILLPTFLLLLPFLWVIAWLLEKFFPGSRIRSKVISFFKDIIKKTSE